MHFFALFHLFSLAVAVGVTVNLPYLKIQGVDLGSGVSQWLGIPYASPPIGRYRWQAPVDRLASRTLYQADTHKPVCLGLYDNATSSSNSEDCLYLDLYAPTGATPVSKLPVYVFFQGGGFNVNANPNLNGTSLVHASGGNIIVITFNYRVGVWGYLASKEIQANGNANAGMLDQRKCLQWVQSYISLFGGDPSSVTIGGDSAGGASVLLQMTAYGGRNDGLFHAAAAESASFGPQLTLTQAQYQYDNLVRKVGCSGSSDTLQCIRQLPTAAIQNNQGNIPYPGQTGNPIYMWSNVIDGNFTVDYTCRMFAWGRFIQVPTIMGADTNDGAQFAPKSIASVGQMNTFLQNNFPNLNQGMLTVINSAYKEGQVYPGAKSFWPTAAQAYGEMRYLCPGLFVSNTQSRMGLSAWNYHYNVLTPTSLSSGAGVGHTAEVNAIWYPTTSAPSNYNATSPFVLAMQGYWTSFIRSKDPNTYRYPGSPEWAQWQPWSGQRLLINNTNTSMETAPPDLLMRCAYMNAIAVSTQQ